MVSPKTRDWKDLVSGSFRDLDDLLKYCKIDLPNSGCKSKPEFTLRVTRYFASLIEKGNPRDPLLLQVLPDALESQLVQGYHEDAVGDRLSIAVPGLIHKYHGRVLMTLTGACPIHCRYCFRQHFPYARNKPDCSASGEIMQYLSQNTSIKEVILSGGDPLMLSDRKLAGLISSLNRIPHINILRIHTRLLSVLPERVNATFLETLRQFNGQLVFVTHINHPNEISAHNRAAFSLLFNQGYRLLNQSVLLKNVNNCPGVLADLSERLFESRITPYYLHRLDKVQGSAHFALSLEDSCRIYEELRKQLPGYLLPSFVQEIAGQASKTPVRCTDP